MLLKLAIALLLCVISEKSEALTCQQYSLQVGCIVQPSDILLLPQNLNSGSASVPGLAFHAAPSTGLFLGTDGNIWVSVGGTAIGSITTSTLSPSSTQEGVVASGTTISTATQLTHNFNTVTTCNSSGLSGVSFPASPYSGEYVEVTNLCSYSIQVFPQNSSVVLATSGTPLSAGSPGLLPPYTTAHSRYFSINNTWIIN